MTFLKKNIVMIQLVSSNSCFNKRLKYINSDIHFIKKTQKVLMNFLRYVNFTHPKHIYSLPSYSGDIILTAQTQAYA